MAFNTRVLWFSLVILGVVFTGACNSDGSGDSSSANASSPAMTGEEKAAAESGKQETYGAVDPDEKPVTSGSDWDVSKVENELSASMMAQVFLKNGIKIEPFAFGVKLVGMTETADSAPPVLLFSGTECTDCDALRSLYIYSVPDRSTVKLDYPGDYHPPSQQKSAPRKRVRFYFGNCLAGTERQLIHRAEVQSGGGRGYTRAITVFSVSPEGKVTQKEERESFPEETDLLARVKQGTCQELKYERFEENP